MNVLVISHAEVVRLLPMPACITVMDEALRATSRGDAVLPLRSVVWMPDRTGMIGLMPGYLGAPASLGLKVVSIFPGNHAAGYDSHQGVVMLFELAHGTPIAIIDASSITGIRTGACSGVATRALARDDAGDLAILGSGVQAATHLDAMRAVRRLRRIRVWSRNPAHAHAFAAARGGAVDGVAIEVMATARDAAVGADLICTTTAAPAPILEGAWLAPGAHINAAGACFARTRELDTAAVVASRLIVDRRESALAEAGDFLIPRAEGAIGDDHIAGELGDVLLGALPGRRSASEITLFKSLGIAIEDLAAAHHIYTQAVATGAGASVPLGPDPA
ncbi:MAG TPA: ornithine cyclodeaminase family protein [Kofleriaceae bacterium]|jgi:ornithine cyclodeaminase|nr:ornithine cyclodeaminase family protein [Kofleriaceae bacterium]